MQSRKSNDPYTEKGGAALHPSTARSGETDSEAAEDEASKPYD